MSQFRGNVHAVNLKVSRKEHDGINGADLRR